MDPPSFQADKAQGILTVFRDIISWGHSPTEGDNFIQKSGVVGTCVPVLSGTGVLDFSKIHQAGTCCAMAQEPPAFRDCGTSQGTTDLQSVCDTSVMNHTGFSFDLCFQCKLPRAITSQFLPLRTEAWSYHSQIHGWNTRGSFKAFLILHL